MAPFSRSPREVWHRQLIASGAKPSLSGGQPLEAFPLDVLRQATDQYLAKKKLVALTSLCDGKLVDMMWEHVQSQDGAKEVAILACLHVLSLSAGNRVLVAFREECTAMSADLRFLQCLVLAHFANPSQIHAGECRAAEALMRLLTGPDFLGSVKLFFESLDAVANSSVLSVVYLGFILQKIQIGQSFELQIDTLRQERRYMKLHNALSWLGAVYNLPSGSLARTLVARNLAVWEGYTEWRPDYLRLMKWEGGRFTEAQKQRLGPVFDLEGPDTTGHGHGCLKESVPGCFEFVRVLDQDPSLLDRLLRLLDKAQGISGSHAVDLFIYLCVDNRDPVDGNLLSLTDTILDTGSDDGIHAILQWLSNLTGFNNRMVALTKVLPVLGSSLDLQSMLAGELSNDVVEVMLSAQSEYGAMLDTGVAENLAMNIHALGKAIVWATWLWPSLPPDLVPTLRRLPPQETLHDIFDSLQTPQAPTALIKSYLRVALAGGDGDAAAMLATIQRNIRFWGKDVDSDRAHLALAISNMDGIEAQVSEDCLQRVLVEDLVLVRALSPVMGTDSNHCCVEIARLFARRVILGHKVDDCWYDFLFCLLLLRADDLLVWSAEELPVGQWFRWLDDLRVLFPRGGQFSLSELGFTPEKYRWWDLLASKYRDALGQLEDLHKRGGNLRWLWFQEVPETVALLDRFQRKDQRSSSVDTFVMSCLQPSIRVIRLVCASLSALKRATPSLWTAFASLYARHEQGASGGWSQPATGALMVAWGQSRAMTSSDREALWAVGGLMGLSIVPQGNGRQMAKTLLMAEHAKLMAVARHLERMRSQLVNHDRSKTSAFLQKLGVEDEVPRTELGIPDRLSGSVESVGEQQWELSFALSRLPAQTRQALGIDDTSRLLLVRISYLKQRPAFCIHLHPNDDAGNRSHGLWSVNGQPPDGVVCWTKPTVFVYLLSRVLCTHLSQGKRDLHFIHDIVSSVLRAPAAGCLVCCRTMGCQLWKPTVCLGGCGEVFQQAPLEVQLGSLVGDPPVLDFLLACVYSAAGDTSALDLLPNCPIPKARLREVIDSFPPLPANASFPELLSQIRGGGEPLSVDRGLLLSYMCTRFRACLVPAPARRRIPAVPKVVQFMLLNSDPDREQAFSKTAALAAGNAGGVTFHGTTVQRMWRILTEGLRNMSRTEYAANAKPDDAAGICLVDEPEAALPYCGSTGTAWRNSAFQNRTVLLACELTQHSQQGTHVVGDASRVAVRYVLLCPEGFVPPQMRVIGDALRTTYAAMRSGAVFKVKDSV
ncbi:hypothetical protein B0T26DRAFT_788369 [Lasiosphaeria miniovina]|uniref:Uncharacterized protein n=1 Tax=Lasiosphaeria miniovina TaxID=1954250 RepID=A0AA40DMA6_9PEZI|nr:uncharacterized protein B0T26DRAFT_788369 [Lasiosphaeria miniovina]KAK0706042.1 hypothetical protein B0T26DRAFT_788369 [Lasiosphaeria miniovina]